MFDSLPQVLFETCVTMKFVDDDDNHHHVKMPQTAVFLSVA